MEEVNQWLTLIANFSVVGGLVFLAYEVRRNSRLSLSQTQTQLLSLGYETHNWKRDPDFADIMVRAEKRDETLSAAEQVQFSTFVFQLLGVWERAHDDYYLGLMKESLWKAWNDTFPPYLANAAWRSAWESMKPAFAVEFQNHVDSYLTDSA